jgi:single-strand DNA-binding protein
MNLNRVLLTGNLTRDPELRATPGGMSVCELRLAVNGRRKEPSTGLWVDDPNYFNIVVFGSDAESCARYLAKGKPIAVDGRLKWREWVAQDGSKRQATDVIAERVQFLDFAGGGDRPPTYDESYAPASAYRDAPPMHEGEAQPAPEPAPEPEPEPAGGDAVHATHAPASAPAGGGAVVGDDDIPF